jgi:hypothetical protein
MKRTFIILLFLIFSFAICSAQQDFRGTWQWKSNSSVFTLKLTQKQDSLSGQHCCVAQNGNKIDCSIKNEITIHGFVKNDSAFITFKSTYCRKTGKAILNKTTPGEIQWRITKEPKGEYYLPKAVLMMLEKGSKN